MVCAPIAPYDSTRRDVRAMVGAGGGFVLVHIATPLYECERRDRKGLYAKARAGADPRVHRHLGPVRRADRRRGRRRHHRPHHRRRPRRRRRRPAHHRPPRPGQGAGVSRLGASAPRTSTSGGPLVEQGAAPLVEQGGPPGPQPRRNPAPDDGARAEEINKPLNVLFVCTANICRSPFMELLARHLAGPDAHVVFSGAGTHGFQAHAMDDVMAATLGPRGVTDVATFASRPLDRDILSRLYAAPTAEAAHRTFILDDHPQLFRKVFTLGQFAETVPGPRRGPVAASRWPRPAAAAARPTPCLVRARPLPPGGRGRGDRRCRDRADAAGRRTGSSARDAGGGSVTELITLTALSILDRRLRGRHRRRTNGDGGGALMTPALIFLGVGEGGHGGDRRSDGGGDLQDRRRGRARPGGLAQPQPRQVADPRFGADRAVGPHVLPLHALPTTPTRPDLSVDRRSPCCWRRSTYALRLYINLRRSAPAARWRRGPVRRPIPTLLVGRAGGLLVGVTSVGSGSVIMVALLMLYPGLSAVKLVGTDLVQAVPLVLAAAISNVALNGIDWDLWSRSSSARCPARCSAARLGPEGPAVVHPPRHRRGADDVGRRPARQVRLDGPGADTTHPLLIAGVGIAIVVLVPVVWGLLRKEQGLPMFGAPYGRRAQDPGASRPEKFRSVAAVDVARVDPVGHVREHVGTPVCDDHVGPLLELVQVAHDLRVEEQVVLQRRLVDDDLDALGLQPLHDALDRGHPEVVGAGLHDQPVDADGPRLVMQDVGRDSNTVIVAPKNRAMIANIKS